MPKIAEPKALDGKEEKNKHSIYKEYGQSGSRHHFALAGVKSFASLARAASRMFRME